LKLRREGYTLSVIADVTGCDKSNVLRFIKKHIAEVTAAPARELVAWEIEKLNILERDAWTQALTFRPALDDKGRPIFDVMYDTAGNPILNPAGQPLTVPRRDYSVANEGKALVLKIHQERCKLLGLNAASKFELLTNPSSTPQPPLTFTVVKAEDGRRVGAVLDVPEPVPVADADADDDEQYDDTPDDDAELECSPQQDLWEYNATIAGNDNSIIEGELA
jgi:hypothetical protein